MFLPRTKDVLSVYRKEHRTTSLPLIFSNTPVLFDLLPVTVSGCNPSVSIRR